jgi:hypothetical protein
MMDEGLTATKRYLLRMSLEMSIALILPEVRKYPKSVRLRQARAAGQALGNYGDALQFRSKAKRVRRGGAVDDPHPLGTAEMHATLARGMACAMTLGADVGKMLDAIYKEES